jgi:hypothetical protein
LDTNPACPEVAPGNAGWFAGDSLVRGYCGRRSEGDRAMGATGKLRGYGATGTSVSDGIEGL